MAQLVVHLVLQGYGAFFSNARGVVHGCLAISLRSCFAYETELLAVIRAVYYVWKKGKNICG